MMEPVTTEAEWNAVLSRLEPWQPPQKSTLIVSPHPDDETLGCGGLIAYLRQASVPVQIAAVTDGEAAYPDTPGLGGVREQEQRLAAQRLGVPEADILRLRLPDSAVTTHGDQLAQHLSSIATTKTNIVAPWPGDPHPDHEACGQAASVASKQTGAQLTFYFFWSWHRFRPERLSGLDLVSFPLTPALLQTRTAALQEHSSQLHRDSGEPILPENLLAPARRPYEVFLPA